MAEKMIEYLSKNFIFGQLLFIVKLFNMEVK